jgi:rRNA maturation endonuclease Nob1
MALYNNQEVEPKKHIMMKVFGSIFALLSCASVAGFIIYLREVEFPSRMLEPFMGPGTIIRPSSVPLVWGQPTGVQYKVLAQSLGIFSSLGLATYFWLFKSSRSKWYSKIGKFLLGLLLYSFYASATKFNYFDIWEWVCPVLFLIVWFIIIRRKGTLPPSLPNDSTPVTSSNNTESSELTSREQPAISHDEDLLRYAPPSISDEVVNDDVQNTSDLQEATDSKIVKIEEPMDAAVVEPVSDDTPKTQPDSAESMGRYCKYCGKPIEEDSRFCRYCGGDLRPKEKNSLLKRILTRMSACFAGFIGFIHHIHVPKVSIDNSRKNKVTRIFKRMGIILVSLLVISAIIWGVDYYFSDVVPRQKAKKILNEQTVILNSTKGEALFKECARIIVDHDIPQAGKRFEDKENLSTLTAIAWVAIKQDRSSCDRRAYEDQVVRTNYGD